MSIVSRRTLGDDLDQCPGTRVCSIWRNFRMENRMQPPLQITFRHMDPSEALASRIHGRAEELAGLYERITACRVVVECRHPRRRQGNLFQVHVDLIVPGREIVVGRDPAARHAHEDAHVAVRDAFDAVRRLLEDYVREGRGKVKLHAVPDHGRIARLLADRDCGFIETSDGAEIYFHRNSVAEGGFDKLTVGDEVRFVAQHGESAQGPQASTVVPLGRHHLPPADAVRA
jgi:cold shock CspA family protein/ribosome-associated translation inhibitor RaiA